jgi:hypothetical protein
MKLHPATKMGPVAGVCCRQSRLRGAVGALILSAALVGAVFLVRHVGAPWYVWGGCALLAGLFVLSAMLDAVAKFRATNWVLWVDPDSLWINLCSFKKRAAAEAVTVIEVKYKEIDHARRHIDTWTMPRVKGGSVHWKLEFLELHLVSDDTRELALALAEERRSAKGAFPSVTIRAPGVIHIAWRGHGLGHDVVPALDQVLAEVSQRAKVIGTTRTDRPDWRKLSEAELDEQVEQLVRWGDELGASELLMRRRGYSSTEAHRLVVELGKRPEEPRRLAGRNEGG